MCPLWHLNSFDFLCPLYLRILFFILFTTLTHTRTCTHNINTLRRLGLQIPFTVSPSASSIHYWRTVRLIEGPGGLLVLLVNGDPADPPPIDAAATPPALSLHLSLPFLSCSWLYSMALIPSTSWPPSRRIFTGLAVPLFIGVRSPTSYCSVSANNSKKVIATFCFGMLLVLN